MAGFHTKTFIKHDDYMTPKCAILKCSSNDFIDFRIVLLFFLEKNVT
jgi:hypothetical protein